MLSALLIDDERFAREELAELLAESGQIEVIGQASNAIEGLKKSISSSQMWCFWIFRCRKFRALSC